MLPGDVPARRRRIARGARAAVAAGVLLLVIGLLYLPPGPPVVLVGRAHAAGGGGGSSHGGATLNVTVNLTDAPAFDPSGLTVVPPVHVNLTVVNEGRLDHTFTLLNRPNFVLNRSWTPARVDAYFAANGSQANVSLPGGNRTNVSLDFGTSQGGFTYEFVSVVPYQFQAGMFGFLNVTNRSSGSGVESNISASAAALAWVPDAVEINASAFPLSVALEISNLGSNAHTFWLVAQPNYTVSPGNFSSYFQAHPPLASLTVPTTPGSVAWANFSVRAAGVYEYICTIPGHLAGGMFGYLYVGVPLPSVAAPPSTALVDVWVLYGGAGLLGVGTVLAAAALLVGRFPKGPGGAHA